MSNEFSRSDRNARSARRVPACGIGRHPAWFLSDWEGCRLSVDSENRFRTGG